MHFSKCIEHVFKTHSKTHSTIFQNMLNMFVKPAHLCTMCYWVYGALWGFCYNCISNTTYSIIVLLFLMNSLWSEYLQHFFYFG